jgi:sulfur carrier protein ThiS
VQVNQTNKPRKVDEETGGNKMSLVKVGVMPGRVNEFVVEDAATVSEILAIAEVSAEGYEVKIDGEKVTDLSTTAGTAGLILLTKQVKGNGLVKVGVMPGRVNEFVVDDEATVHDILRTAEVSAEGYEVKIDGEKVTDFNQSAGTAGLILLTKQVKGNNDEEHEDGSVSSWFEQLILDPKSN